MPRPALLAKVTTKKYIRQLSQASLYLGFLLVSLAVIATLAFFNKQKLLSLPFIASIISKQTNQKIVNLGNNALNTADTSKTGYKLYDEAAAKVLPDKSFQSKVYLSDSIIKLMQKGVIDREKFEAIYKERGGLPNELKIVLDQSSNTPILLTTDNANIYVNLLWPIGLSNYMASNSQSPVNGKDLYHFASTGGWNIGKEKNGGAYFNKYNIVVLTPDQEALVTKIAKNSYRPCCDNSTFFQDCNHGSALLGLLQLGAAEGLSEEELYKEALVFNSFWFPNNYIQTALYFKVIKNTNWENVDPKTVLSYDYSAISQWSKNVAAEIAKIPNLLPEAKAGGKCGV